MKIWTIVFLALVAAFGVGCAIDLQESDMAFGDDSLGVTGFPRIIGILLALAAIGLMLHTAFKSGDKSSLKGSVDYRALVALALSVAYVLGVCYLGFRISTVLYLLALPPLFDNFRFASRTSVLWIAAYAIGVTVVFHFFFGIFKVYLPPTILF